MSPFGRPSRSTIESMLLRFRRASLSPSALCLSQFHSDGRSAARSQPSHLAVEEAQRAARRGRQRIKPRDECPVGARRAGEGREARRGGVCRRRAGRDGRAREGRRRHGRVRRGRRDGSRAGATLESRRELTEAPRNRESFFFENVFFERRRARAFTKKETSSNWTHFSLRSLVLRGRCFGISISQQRLKRA